MALEGIFQSLPLKDPIGSGFEIVKMNLLLCTVVSWNRMLRSWYRRVSLLNGYFSRSDD